MTFRIFILAIVWSLLGGGVSALIGCHVGGAEHALAQQLRPPIRCGENADCYKNDPYDLEEKCHYRVIYAEFVMNLQYATSPAPEVAAFPGLEEVKKGMKIYNNVGMKELHMPALRVVTGKLELNSNGQLVRLELPSLEWVGDDAYFANGNAQLELNLPRLHTVEGGLSVTGLPALHSVDIRALRNVSGVEVQKTLLYPVNLTHVDVCPDQISVLVSASGTSRRPCEFYNDTSCKFCQYYATVGQIPNCTFSCPPPLPPWKPGSVDGGELDDRGSTSVVSHGFTGESSAVRMQSPVRMPALFVFFLVAQFISIT